MAHCWGRESLALWLVAGLVGQQLACPADAHPRVADAGLMVEELGMGGGGGLDPREEFSPEAIRRKAEAGIPSAQYSVAQGYHYGGGRQRDLEKARRWYERAASQGHAWSQRVLGTMLAVGEGGATDRAAAAKWLRRAAEQGDAYAMAELGVLLRLAPQLVRNQREAYCWLEKAALRGDARAQYHLALALELGEGVEADRAQARIWLRLASLKEDAARLYLQDVVTAGSADPASEIDTLRGQAEKGDLESEFKLGMRLLDGIGLPPDEDAASHWLQKAADRGHAGAMFHLHQYLSRGPSVTTPAIKAWLEKSAYGGYPAAQTLWARYQDFGSAEMVRWLRAAAEQGDLNALYHLGSLPFQAPGEIGKDEGVSLLERAAEQGHVDAQYTLGIAYSSGWAEAPDHDAALKWSLEAANQGHAEAMAMVGRMSERSGAEIGGMSSFEWLLKAEEMGALNLTSVIAQKYAEGEGTLQDPVLALRWYIEDVKHDPAAYEWGQAEKIRALLQAHPEAPFDYEPLVRFLSKAAGWGYPEAQCDLGMLYREGRGVRRNAAEAKKWLELAAKGGVVEAVEVLAQMLSTGEGIPADDAQAVKLLEESAEEGDRRSQFALSRRYLEGRGVQKNMDRALALLKSAAAAELPEAQHELGLRLIRAEGVPLNVREGVHLVNKAAETLPEARLYLMDWLQGYPEPTQARVPFKELLAEAERGDPAAQLELGERYRLVPPKAADFQRSLDWIRKAAEQGHPQAQLRLAELLSQPQYVRDGSRKPADYEESLTWLKRAADQGHAPAQYALAKRWLRGVGTEPDAYQAIAWFGRAAEQGHAGASENLGDLYGHWGSFRDLELPPFDRKAAQAWYLRAVSQGRPDAYLGIARLYDQPPSGPRDPVEAMKWSQRALEAGVQSAAWRLADGYLHGEGVPADPARAIALLEDLYELGDEHGAGRGAMKRLGEIFEKGEGVPRDLKRAIACYQRAAEFTNSGPAFHVAELYHSGPAEIRNPSEALRWYLTAIDYWIEGGDGTEVFGGPIAEPYRHLADARFALAQKLERGDGLERDLSEALRWYQRAAYFRRKYPATAALAALKAASLLEQGVGRVASDLNGGDRPSDPPLDWYKKAAEMVEILQPDRLVFHDRWNDEYELVGDMDRRLPPLIEAIRRAARRGIPEAQFDLARFYLLGRGVPRNNSQALIWLAKASAQGHLAASCKLGELLTQEIGEKPASRDQALTHFRTAAQRAFLRIPKGTRFDDVLKSETVPKEYAAVKKSLSALIQRKRPPEDRANVSVFVMEIGKERVPATLQELKELAKRKGYPDSWAEAAMKARPFIMKAEEARTTEEAAGWMARAAEVGYPEAQAKLALQYESGRGMAKDPLRAYTWFCLAAAYGQSDGRPGMYRLSEQLTKAQIEEAQGAAMEWWSRHHSIPVEP